MVRDTAITQTWGLQVQQTAEIASPTSRVSGRRQLWPDGLSFNQMDLPLKWTPLTDHYPTFISYRTQQV